MSLETHIIKPDSSILSAMQKLTENNTDILVVIDDQDKVCGIVTDGDIRRGILKQGDLEQPISEIMTKDFFSVRNGENRAHLLDIMLARRIRHIPIIDRDGKFKGIHFFSHIIGTKHKDNPAVIMAGGKGTRLRPITENCPKPMLKVAGRPILERIILHLVSHGITKIFLSVNYMGETIEEYFGTGEQYGCEIKYLKEDKPLGTGGALKLLPSDIEQDIIVMNGDLITNIDITAMLSLHENRQAAATMASKRLYTQIAYGVIEKEDGFLKNIHEKPTLNHEVNTGTYVISPKALEQITPDVEYPITDLFDALRKKNEKTAIFESVEDWIDVGQHEDYKRAQGAL